MRKMKDITPTEQVISDYGKLFISAMEQCSVSMVVTDKRGVITYANQKFLKETGYSMEELLDKTPSILKTEFTPPEVYTDLWSTILKGREWKGEFVNKRKDGGLFWERATISPIRDEAGVISGFLGVKEDITEVKSISSRLDFTKINLQRANRALRARHAVNHELIDAISESLFLDRMCQIMVDIGGYKLAWIGARMNDEEKRVLPVAQAGFEEDYLTNINITWADEPTGRGPTGTAIRSLSPQITRDTTTDSRFAPWKEEAIKRGFASSGAFPIMVEDVVWGALMVYSSERDAFDQEEIDLLSGLAKDAGFGIGVIRERDARRRMEEERRRIDDKMRQAQKMESMGLLASGVAHDFNNLLSSIMVNLDLARMELPKESEAVNRINDAMKASQRSAEICRHMLTYTGQSSGVFKMTDINELIREMAQLLQVSFSKKIMIELDLDPQSPQAKMDAVGVSQVVMNLITNAAEAMGEDGGKITVRSREIQNHNDVSQSYFETIDTERGPWVLIEVMDNGPGLDEETTRKMFDPFFSTKPKGRGLGLAVVLGIIRAHNGSVAVKSARGDGATISVMLPTGGASKTLGGATRIETSVYTRATTAGSGAILIIEDEEHLRTACRLALDMCGYKVHTASNGKEGLATLYENSDEIDLVILDLSMPVMDGRETLTHLKKLKKQVAVILTSGYDKSMDKQIPQSESVACFLAKPFSSEQLIGAVNRVMKGESRR